jgi:hypothetical protein
VALLVWMRRTHMAQQNQQIERARDTSSALTLAVTEGDLSRMSAEERRTYYAEVCRTLGLNPLTKPFDYLKLNGRLVLYAAKGCTDQLRALHGISVVIESRTFDHGLCIVVATASRPDGRRDSDIGAVVVENLKGEALANALMKAATKAKRRVTLSLCGLGMLDESELEAVPQAQRERVTEDGEVVEASSERPTPAQNDAAVERFNELAAAADLDVLKRLWLVTESDFKSGHLHPQHRDALKTHTNRRKKELAEPSKDEARS